MLCDPIEKFQAAGSTVYVRVTLFQMYPLKSEIVLPTDKTAVNQQL